MKSYQVIDQMSSTVFFGHSIDKNDGLATITTSNFCQKLATIAHTHKNNDNDIYTIRISNNNIKAEAKVHEMYIHKKQVSSQACVQANRPIYPV